MLTSEALVHRCLRTTEGILYFDGNGASLVRGRIRQQFPRCFGGNACFTGDWRIVCFDGAGCIAKMLDIPSVSRALSASPSSRMSGAMPTSKALGAVHVCTLKVQGVPSTSRASRALGASSGALGASSASSSRVRNAPFPQGDLAHRIPWQRLKLFYFEGAGHFFCCRTPCASSTCRTPCISFRMLCASAI